MARFDYREAHAAPAVSGGWREGIDRWLRDQPQMAYVLPFFAFVLVMVPGAFGHLGGIDWEEAWRRGLPVIYPLKTLLAAVLLWWLWPYYTRIRWTKLHWGVAVGLLGTVAWVGTVWGTEWVCQRFGFSLKADASSLYNPDLMLGQGPAQWAYLCVRVAGPTLVVPLMEELFFRDFVMRTFIAGSRFEEVAVGSFTWASLLGMSLLFGLNHGRMFLAGVVYGLLMGVLLIRTKSLGACIVAHGVTNFTLYLYVIWAGDWQFM